MHVQYCTIFTEKNPRISAVQAHVVQGLAVYALSNIKKTLKLLRKGKTHRTYFFRHFVVQHTECIEGWVAGALGAPKCCGTGRHHPCHKFPGLRLSKFVFVNAIEEHIVT